MKICLVTAFPPSRGGLSEYGFHIARELQQNPLLSLTVLADVVPDAPAEDGVIRCWSFNDPRSAKGILDAIREIKPDIVWFNLLFTTFGHHPWVAFRGLTLPLQTRLAGFYTHVTLHHLMDFIDLEGAGIRFPALYRTAGTIATKMLLFSNSLSVLMPAYRNILLNKYGGDNVHFRSHGILAQTPEYPDFSRRNNPAQRILAFGKWGTYKRLEPLIEAFQIVARQLPHAKLVIAGGDHPRTPGYVASLARKYESTRIEFTGYVPEDRVADLFRSASVAVMPYSSSTGASGVAHLACAYGLPIVSSDVPDFVHMADVEGMGMEFYRTDDVQDLADKLRGVLQSPEQQKAMAIQNFTAALRMTMPRVIQDYIRHFGVAQQTRALRRIRWHRRLPAWASRSFLGKALLRGRRPGKERQLPFPSTGHLFNSNGQNRGSLSIPGGSNHGHGIVGSGFDFAHSSAPTRSKGNGANHDHGNGDASKALPIYLPDTHQPNQAEREQTRIDEPVGIPLPKKSREGLS